MSPWGSFFLVLLAVGLYGWVHSWLASLGMKAWVTRVFGAAAARSYRLLYNLFAVISLLPVLALAGWLSDRLLYTIGFPWLGLSLLAQAAGAVALLVGVLQTGLWSFLGLRQLFEGESESRPASLVVDGLYRYVRHPLYTAGLVFIWASPVMTVNLLALYLGFSLYLVVGAYVEERKLLHEFGRAYLDYRACTPMFVPGLKFSRPAGCSS